jgi:hypothetical protein
LAAVIIIVGVQEALGNTVVDVFGRVDDKTSDQTHVNIRRENSVAVVMALATGAENRKILFVFP